MNAKRQSKTQTEKSQTTFFLISSQRKRERESLDRLAFHSYSFHKRTLENLQILVYTKMSENTVSFDNNKRRRTDGPHNNNTASGKEQHRQHSKRKLVQQSSNSSSKFGRVMESVPCRNKPRHATLSIAIPGSALANCVTKELQTLWAGQIARAATIYHVDEIVVFDDKLTVIPTPWNRRRSSNDSRDRNYEKINNNKTTEPHEYPKDSTTEQAQQKDTRKDSTPRTTDPHLFLARILQYCECPQYLRKHFFPMHPDLQFTGLLPPMDAPHHVRALDRSKYREGVVLDRMGPKGNSLVHCGIPAKPVE